jgi:uncharacterized protein (DUF4415 family)
MHMRKEYDFSRAKRAKDVPHLARLQAEAKGKTRITIMLDNFVIEAFRELAEAEGIGYQTLINRTLRQALTDEHITEESLRRVIREEMARHK